METLHRTHIVAMCHLYVTLHPPTSFNLTCTMAHAGTWFILAVEHVEQRTWPMELSLLIIDITIWTWSYLLRRYTKCLPNPIYFAKNIQPRERDHNRFTCDWSTTLGQLIESSDKHRNVCACLRNLILVHRWDRYAHILMRCKKLYDFHPTKKRHYGSLTRPYLPFWFFVVGLWMESSVDKLATTGSKSRADSCCSCMEECLHGNSTYNFTDRSTLHTSFCRKKPHCSRRKHRQKYCFIFICSLQSGNPGL